MEHQICAHCDQEFEGKGVNRHGKLFCSTECCDDFELDLSSEEDPDLEDLVEDDLGYRNGDFDDDDELDDLDDDFSINPDDF